MTPLEFGKICRRTHRPARAFVRESKALYKSKAICFTDTSPVKRRFCAAQNWLFPCSLRSRKASFLPGKIQQFIAWSLFVLRHRNRPLPFKNTLYRAKVPRFIRPSCDIKTGRSPLRILPAGPRCHVYKVILRHRNRPSPLRILPTGKIQRFIARSLLVLRHRNRPFPFKNTLYRLRCHGL